MKRALLLFFAFLLLPIYPLMRKMQKMGDKVRFGEKVVVVLINQKKKRILIT